MYIQGRIFLVGREEFVGCCHSMHAYETIQIFKFDYETIQIFKGGRGDSRETSPSLYEALIYN